MKFGQRSRSVAVGWLAIVPATAAVLVGAATLPDAIVGEESPATTSAAPAITPRARAIENLVALDVVSRGPNNSLIFDFGKDPAAAERALTSASLTLDDMTFRTIGMTVLTPDQLRKQDAALVATDAPVTVQKCAPEPTGPRLEGATQAYLGCDEATGVVKLGDTFTAPAEASLEAALAQSIASSLSDGVDAPSVVVSLNGGAARVDLPTEFAATLSALPLADAYELKRNATFTTYSNADVSSVRFQLAGDCQAFAVAVGGDACGQTVFPPSLGQG